MGVSRVVGSLPSPSPHVSSTSTHFRPEREQPSSVTTAFQPWPVGAAPLGAPLRPPLSGASLTLWLPTSDRGTPPPQPAPPEDRVVVEDDDDGLELDDPDDVLHAATATHDATSAMRLEERLMEDSDRAASRGMARKKEKAEERPRLSKSGATPRNRDLRYASRREAWRSCLRCRFRATGRGVPELPMNTCQRRFA
jgi:hypothetical protein